MLETRNIPTALALLAALAWPAAQAQDKIWRCGNEYTNQPGDARARGCKPVEGGNLTVIEGLKPQPGAKPAAASTRASGAAARSDAERVDGAEQRARDSDARAILEAELRKAESRLADLRQEYRDGNPEQRPEELRNPPLYQQRAAALKEQVARAEADVAAIRRELARLSPDRK
ncbi:MAG: hypothetical protein RLZZ555_2358 [Pseudomonadota bacterium]|jgi:hypothetical protein